MLQFNYIKYVCCNSSLNTLPNLMAKACRYIAIVTLYKTQQNTTEAKTMVIFYGYLHEHFLFFVIMTFTEIVCDVEDISPAESVTVAS